MSSAPPATKVIDHNARQKLLDAWVGVPLNTKCALVKRDQFKELFDTTSNTQRKKATRDLSAATRAFSSAPPPPPS